MLQTARTCFTCLSGVLGKKDHLISNDGTSIDAIIFAFLSHILHVKYTVDSSLQTMLTTEFAPLVSFVKLFQSMHFNDSNKLVTLKVPPKPNTEIKDAIDTNVSRRTKYLAYIAITMGMLLYARRSTLQAVWKIITTSDDTSTHENDVADIEESEVE